MFETEIIEGIKRRSLCRLSLKRAGQDTLLMVTEDAKPGHVDVYSLASDFGGYVIGSIVSGVVTGLIR